MAGLIASDPSSSEECVDREPPMDGAHGVLCPTDVLGTRERHEARKVEELVLTGRQAIALSPKFQHFQNLTALWLGGNKLTCLKQLAHARNLQEVTHLLPKNLFPQPNAFQIRYRATATSSSCSRFTKCHLLSALWPDYFKRQGTVLSSATSFKQWSIHQKRS
eukprot:GHVT01042627.1.p1 GENE.GHVT01042627.1~~GHVT01042627.1.p1  ORF type:complete len:163 (-),score=14.09 GHVT01042627.1:161-649(-)